MLCYNGNENISHKHTDRNYSKLYKTRISRHNAPFILAPAECFGGPSAQNLGLQYNDLIVCDYMCLQPYVPNMIRNVSKTSHHHQWLGGLWEFRIVDMEDMSHPWHFKCSSHMIPIWCNKFQLPSMIWSVSRTTPWSSVTWRTLMVTKRWQTDKETDTAQFYLY